MQLCFNLFDINCSSEQKQRRQTVNWRNNESNSREKEEQGTTRRSRKVKINFLVGGVFVWLFGLFASVPVICVSELLLFSVWSV